MDEKTGGHAATVTPAQAAYEAAVATGHATIVPWKDLLHVRRRAWEAIAQAAIKAAQVDDDADMRDEMDNLREQYDDLRDQIDSLARGLDMSASTSRPSKKSEIESGVAAALRGLLRIDGESGEETRQRLERERGTSERVAELVTEGNELREERDKAYEERAKLIAYLTAVYPSEITPAESDSGAWNLVFVATPSGQMSWHLHEDDIVEYFQHLVNLPETGVTWDGHTTKEKYRRLAELTRTVATGLYGPQPHHAPAAATAGTEHLAADLAARREDGQ